MKITLLNRAIRRTLTVSLTLALTLSACGDKTENVVANKKTELEPSAQVSATLAKENMAELYQQATQTLFTQRAFSATVYGLSANDVGGYYTDKVEDFSPENEQKLRQSLLALSQKIAKASLSNTDQLSKDNQQVMAGLTRYFAGHPDFSIGYIDTWMGLSPFVVNQINGPLINIPRNLQNDHQIKNEQDALDYIARLAKFDQLIASIEEKLAFDVAQDWIAPKALLKGAVRYLTGFIKSAPKDHPLVEAFIEKINKVDGLSAQQKKQLTAQAIEKVTTVVYPAYRSITAKVELLLPIARAESGIWAQPKGDQYYQDAINQLGDSNLSANEIHQLGLDEVTRISAAMDKILLQQGYKDNSVGQRMVQIGEEPKFLYQDSTAGRAELLKDINGYIAEITKKMAPVFKTTPSYQVEVRAYPVEIQDGSPGGEYTSPSLDGEKPGIYWINLRDMKANPKFGLKTLTYHEANPGHHWQIALNMGQADLPFLRRIAPYNAYTEGWALYSEQVAYELGMYENDPFGNLGRLQAELYRAVRLVVDTGLHHKKWTREQAIEFMMAKTGSAESDITSEIERYMAWPGQALGYKLGMLKMQSLRKQAETQLGDKFELSAFHDVVLLGGAVPMQVLERNIHQWISKQKM